MVRVAVSCWPGLSCTSRPGPCTHDWGTPSAKRLRWSTVVPVLASVTLTITGCPGGSVTSSCSAATWMRPLSVVGGATAGEPYGAGMASEPAYVGAEWKPPTIAPGAPESCAEFGAAAADVGASRSSQ